jgi:hypothetical protein
VATSPPWKAIDAPAHSFSSAWSSPGAAANPASSMPRGSLCASVSHAIRVAIVSCSRGTVRARPFQTSASFSLCAAAAARAA